MASLITPINIFAVVFGLFLGGLLLWQYRTVSQAFIDCLKALGNCLRVMFQSGNDFRKKVFSRTAFFWLVNLVFMAISAYHAAPFFGSVISSVPGLEAIGPYIGLPVAFVMDGITIVFMQARLEANYKHDKKKSGMYIRYVFASAALNTLANLYTDIQHFDATRYNKVGEILLFCAPLVLSIFPMFLVAISKAADEMVNVKPLEDIDVEEYRKDEEKRVSILEAQNEFLDRETQAEQRLIEIEMRQKENENRRRGKALRAPKVEREFFLVRWFFPQRQPRINLDDVTNKIKEMYAPQVQALTEQNKKLQAETSQFVSVIENLQRQIEELQVSQNTLFEVQLNDAMSFTENETPERTYPDIDDETEDETFYTDSDELDDVDRDTDPNQVAVTKDETPGSDNITFLHSTVKTKRETSARNKSARKTAAQKAAAIIKNNPNITPAELAKKAKITSQYAGRLLSRQTVVNETM